MGPTTEKEGILDDLIANGMNCARFNFSHGDHAEHLGRITAVREAAAKADKVISLILDTKGPEMRLGEFRDGKWVTSRVWNGDQVDYGLTFNEKPALLRVTMGRYK